MRVAFPERWQSQVGRESLVLGFFKKIIYSGHSGSSLLRGFLQLWRARAALQLQRTSSSLGGFSLQSTGSKMPGLQ